MAKTIQIGYTISKTGIGLSDPFEEPVYLGISYNKRHVMVDTNVSYKDIGGVLIPEKVFEISNYNKEELIATAYERTEFNVRKEFGEQLRIKSLEAELFFRR